MLKRIRDLIARRRRPVTTEEAEARLEGIKALAEMERIPASGPGINPGSFPTGG